MFAGWLQTRLKAAQRALDEGRVDDAFAAATRPDVRKDPRGARLAEGLQRPLLARARLSAQAGRYRDALDDLDRLRAIQQENADAAELRRRVEVELRLQNEHQAARSGAIAVASEALRAGRLDSAREAVPRVPDETQRGQLSAELDARQRRADHLLDQARAARQRGDVSAAVALWHEARTRGGRTSEGDLLAGALAADLRTALEAWFHDGRIERFLAGLDSAALLRPHDAGLSDLARFGGLLRRGGEELARGDHAALRQTLLRMKASGGEAKWLSEALELSGRLVDAHEALLAGPLGAMATQPGRREPAPPMAPPAAQRDDEPDADDGQGLALGRRGVLLLADGAGSALLLGQDRVRIGRSGGDAEILIPSDVQSIHAEIARVGDDYFLSALAPVEVNRRPAQRVLLRDGDRISLGGRARMVFCKPSTRSETAVLRLAHGCRLAQDVSAVVLFRETCLVGPQPSCHLRTHEGQSQAVIFERGGRLQVRHVCGEQKRMGDAHPVPEGRSIDLGDVRVTFKRYEPRGSQKLA